MTEWLHFHLSLSCIGEGNGNPLRCSCLENPRDGGAWWAAISGVAQSQTRLKQLSSSSSSRFPFIQLWERLVCPGELCFLITPFLYLHWLNTYSYVGLSKRHPSARLYSNPALWQDLPSKCCLWKLCLVGSKIGQCNFCHTLLLSVLHICFLFITVQLTNFPLAPTSLRHLYPHIGLGVKPIKNNLN